MSRTARDYERVFEDLIEYTDFESVDSIKGKNYDSTNKNLRKAFKQIHDDKSYRSGKNFRVTKSFAYEFGSAFWRIVKDHPAITKRIHISRREMILKARPVLNYKTAKDHNLIAINEDKFEVFKSYVVIRGKRVTRFRDKRGRFRKGLKK